MEEILATNGAAFAVRAAVTDELDVERLFDETAAAFGSVDVVVQTGVRGSAVLNREAARRLRHGGAIVIVSSSEAITPELADALRARDITVNGVPPGLEPPGAEHDIADLVGLLEQWRSVPLSSTDTRGPGRGFPGRAGSVEAGTLPAMSIDDGGQHEQY